MTIIEPSRVNNHLPTAPGETGDPGTPCMNTATVFSERPLAPRHSRACLPAMRRLSAVVGVHLPRSAERPA